MRNMKYLRNLALTLLLLVVMAFPSVAIGATKTYYTNVYGNQIHTPMRAQMAPIGASARCRDGAYSFSQSRRGTCSGHGGVSTWLR